MKFEVQNKVEFINLEWILLRREFTLFAPKSKSQSCDSTPSVIDLRVILERRGKNTLSHELNHAEDLQRRLLPVYVMSKKIFHINSNSAQNRSSQWQEH